MKLIRSLIREEKGQGLTEYALIIALVAVLLVGSLIALKGQLVTVFNDIVSGLKSK